jgi:hypothetical protein
MSHDFAPDSFRLLIEHGDVALELAQSYERRDMYDLLMRHVG